MMGTGKSTVGRAVDERAGVPFIDLDDELVRQAGMSIRQIFEKRGESAFRSMEREALSRQLDDRTPRVVALGGGALLGRAERLIALERAIVVTLAATPTELLRRMTGDGTRPMFGDQPTAARMVEILDARATAYAEAHAVIDTTGSTIDTLVREVLDIVQSDPIAF